MGLKTRFLSIGGFESDDVIDEHLQRKAIIIKRALSHNHYAGYEKPQLFLCHKWTNFENSQCFLYGNGICK